MRADSSSSTRSTISRLVFRRSSKVTFVQEPSYSASHQNISSTGSLDALNVIVTNRLFAFDILYYCQSFVLFSRLVFEQLHEFRRSFGDRARAYGEDDIAA